MGTEHGEKSHLTPPTTENSTGTIYSYTIVNHDPVNGIHAPSRFTEQAPYCLALIDLDNGPRIEAQLTDLNGKPELEMPVEMVTRILSKDGETGIILYGPKFRPILEKATSS